MRRSTLTVAAAIFLTTHAANLQIPLYNTYAQNAGFDSGISAIAFSTYVAGLLPTLILLGGISDRIGRRTVILSSLTCAGVATFLMILNPTIYTLFVTRILQGISVGLITGTGTAYLSTLMPKNSAQVATHVSLTTSLGFSSGALFTNATLLYSNSLDPISYWVVFLLISGCIGLAIGLAEQPTAQTALVRL
ncbi:MAG TPA: MFS transporter, partial [Allocoleopsis sp.]